MPDFSYIFKDPKKKKQMKIKNLILACLVVMVTFFSLYGCTDNQRTKHFGGEMVIELPKGMKLFDVTWKEKNLWYTYRQARPDEKPETLYFKELSDFGVMEGTVIFKEDF